MNNFLKILFWLKANILIVVAFLFFIFYFLGLYFIYFSGSDLVGSKNIEIKSGWGLVKIADELESNRVIKSSFVFEVYAWLAGKEKIFQAGNYVFNSGIKIPEIIKMLESGEVLRNEASITIPEGYNIYQIAEKLENAGLGKKSNFLNLILKPQNFNEKYAFLNCDKTGVYGCPKNLEGYLFPDTYIFDKNTTLQMVIGKFLDNFKNKAIKDLSYSIYQSGKSLYEIIIMASLIEKEVKTFEDMEIVSGILWKRLDNNVALQVDASVAYAKCAVKPINCKIEPPLIEDLKIKSPYNTYLYQGLPVAAISNPGLLAIKAAISPKKSDYWYYLTAKDGKTIFSKTLEEHNRNRAKYLQ